MKTPEWTDSSHHKDGSSWLMQCDGFWITLIKSNYPAGFHFECKQVGIENRLIKNTNPEDAKLIALQLIDENLTSLNRAAKRLKLAENAQAKIVFGDGD